MPPNQQDQYDFIMNPGTNRPQAPKFGNSMASRLLIVGGGLLLLITLIVVVLSVLGSGDKDQTNKLIKVAQTQTELVRVSTLGLDKAKDITTRNLIINTKLSTQSSLQDVKSLLNERGIGEKSLASQITAGKDARVDEALALAEKSNRYDEVLQNTLNDLIVTYQQDLQAAFESGSEAEREALSSAFKSSSALAAKKE